MYFQSRDRGGRHAIWSPYPKTPCCMQAMALSSVQPELLWDIGNFVLLLIWPWPLPDDLHIRTWPVSPQLVPDCQKWTLYLKAFKSYHITYRHATKTCYHAAFRVVTSNEWGTSGVAPVLVEVYVGSSLRLMWLDVVDLWWILFAVRCCFMQDVETLLEICTDDCTVNIVCCVL